MLHIPVLAEGVEYAHHGGSVEGSEGVGELGGAADGVVSHDLWGLEG